MLCILSRVPTQAVKREHTYVEAEPKTQKSRRNVVIASFALELLKQHRIQQLESKLNAGTAGQEHDYVFCSPTGTYLSPGHNALVQLKILLEKADLPDIRFHDLRHSAATLLLAIGVHAKVVQELLGHSNITMTLNIYSHVLPSLQEDAMDKLSSILNDQRNVT